MATPTSRTEALLADWLRRARESQWGHYEAEKSLVRAHYGIGLPLVIFTAFSGTSIFATLSLDPKVWFKILVALTSVVAAILGGLQTFLRSSDRAAAHRAAATRYAALRRTIEVAVARSATAPMDDSALDKLRERLSELADQSPAIPRRVWKRTERLLVRRSQP